jgi:NAD(P)-dependent dehydrogenase (short-subunit alcohol dehydrogenase family)
MRLQGKRIVIIGGSSGMGLATAKAAAAEGAQVVIASRSMEKLQRAKSEIQGTVEVFPVDIREEETVKDFFAKVGKFDHLATPGTEGVKGNFLELDVARARKAFDSKIWGQYHAAKYGAPMIRPGGSITLMAGSYSQRPHPGVAVAATMNGAMESLGRALAVELAPIRVNVISPGVVDTPLHLGMPEEQRKAFFNAVISAQPVKRIGLAEEIAQAFLFLMNNAYITGSTLFVDGGMTLR